MKMSELMVRPLSELLTELELITMKPSTDRDGNVTSIDLKYIDPKIYKTYHSDLGEYAKKKPYKGSDYTNK